MLPPPSLSLTHTHILIETLVRKGTKYLPESYQKCLQVSSSVNEKSLFTLSSRKEWAMSLMANVGWEIMNPAMRILPLSSANGILRGRISG